MRENTRGSFVVRITGEFLVLGMGLYFLLGKSSSKNGSIGCKLIRDPFGVVFFLNRLLLTDL